MDVGGYNNVNNVNNILVYVQKMPTKIKVGWFTSMVLVYLTSMAVGEAP